MAKPKYKKLVDILEKDIRGNTKGGKLPSVAKLCSKYKVSQATLVSALDILEQRKLILRKERVGIFVRDVEASFGGGLVDLILPGQDEILFLITIRAVHSALSQYGYRLKLSITHDNPEDELGILKQCSMEKSLGVIAMLDWPTNANVKVLKELSSIKPVVQIDRKYSSVKTNYVSVDNYRGAKDATRYAMKDGIREIGVIRPPRINLSSSMGRYQGYLDALREAGIEPNEDLEVRLTHNEEENNSIIRDYIAKHTSLPPFFVGLNSKITKSFFTAARNNGLLVPKDIKVISFGIPDVFKDFVPPVTLFAQDSVKVGTEAVNLLHSNITGKSKKHEQILIPPTFIQGNSCGRINSVSIKSLESDTRSKRHNKVSST